MRKFNGEKFIYNMSRPDSDYRFWDSIPESRWFGLICRETYIMQQYMDAKENGTL